MTNELASNQGSWERSAFIDHLDSEIGLVLEERRREGWTSWAIVGAIAVLIWLLLDILETGSFSQRDVSFALLGVYFLYIPISFIAFLQRRKSEVTPRFRYIHQQPIASLLISLLYLSVLISLLVQNLEGLSPLGRTAAFTILSLLFILMLSVTFIGVVLRLPVHMGPTSLNTSGKIVLGSLGLVSAFAGYSMLVAGLHTITVDDVRVTALLLAVAYLIQRLAQTQRNVLADSLIETRRALAFRKIELEAARKQVDIALLGMTVADVLKDEVRQHLDLIAKVDKSFADMLEVFKAVGKELPVSGDLREDRRVVVKSMMRGTKLEIASIKGYLASMSKIIKRLSRKSAVVAWISPQAKQETEKVLEVVQTSVNDMDSKSEEIEREADELLKRIAELSPGDKEMK